MNIGFYAGSFDPFTKGHLEIVTKASKLFDQVIIGIGDNSGKTRRFDKNLMKSAIEQVLRQDKLDNVTVISYNNLTTDIAIQYNCSFLIRGLRNSKDYEEEEIIASINKEISGLDTIYLRTDDLENVSSTMVMELFRNGKDVSKYVPNEISKIMTSNPSN